MNIKYFGINIREIGRSYAPVLMSSFRQGKYNLLIYIPDSSVLEDEIMKEFLKLACDTGYSVTLCATKSQLPEEKNIEWRIRPIP